MRTLVLSFLLFSSLSLAYGAGPIAGEEISIDQAVAEARGGNLDLSVKKARLPALDAMIVGARLRPNPTVGIIADHLDLLYSRFTEENGAGPTEITVNTEFTWERGRKRFHRTRLATLERETAGHQVKDDTRILALEVQNAFVDLLLAQKNLALTGENREGMQKLLSLNQLRVEKGDLAEVDLVRTQVAVAQLEDQEAAAASETRKVQFRLRRLLGRAESAPLPVAKGDFRNDADLPEASALVRLALAGRPDVLAAKNERARAEADVELQKAMAKGDLTLGAEYRRQQGVNGKGNSLGFSVSIPLPVFHKNQGEIARARAEAAQSDLAFAALVQSLHEEAAEACEQCRAALAQIQRLERDTLARARQVREVAVYSYQRGEVSLVEVLDAQRAFNEIMQSYLTARAELARSRYRLDSIAGKE